MLHYFLRKKFSVTSFAQACTHGSNFSLLSNRFTGQVYFTLIEAREKRGIKDIAISRVEQLSPFPYDLITPHLDKYPNASLLWCQEEPLNNGAWSYVGPRIYTAAGQTEHHKGKYPLYAGRDPTSSVATGSKASFFFFQKN